MKPLVQAVKAAGRASGLQWGRRGKVLFTKQSVSGSREQRILSAVLSAARPPLPGFVPSAHSARPAALGSEGQPWH